MFKHGYKMKLKVLINVPLMKMISLVTLNATGVGQ